jgi:hypothetical protein
VEYTGSSGIWTATAADSPLYLTKSDATLAAYYPYTSSLSAGTAALSSQLYASDKDFCYQTGVTGNSSSSVSFLLSHAYSEMTFSIKRDASYPGTCAVSDISVANAGILSSNTLDITNVSNGYYGTYGSGTAGTVSVDPAISSIASGNSKTVTVLMVPVSSAMAGNLSLSFTIDGTVMTTSIDLSSIALTRLKAGTNYSVSVTVKGTGLSVSSVKTTDWSDVAIGDLNTVSFQKEANCYMLPLGETIYIPVSRARTGNPDDFTSSWTAELLWTDNANGVISSGDIESISYDNDMGYIKVTSGSSEGNSVICLKNSSGTIVWSWHIWVTNYNPDTEANGTINTINNTNGSYTWMDRNLGATTATPGIITTRGLLYQWGRKDPFTASNVIYSGTNGEYNSIPIYNDSGTQLTEGAPTGGTGINSIIVSVANNLSNSINNPMTFYYGTGGDNIGNDWYTNTDSRTAQNDELWGSSDPTTLPSDKTIYDPCPAGWRVPAWNGASPWSSFNTNNFVTVETQYGRVYNNEIFYPATGYRHSGSGSLYSIGISGAYWTGSISSTPKYAYFLLFYSEALIIDHNYNRAYGFCIRCVKE